MKYFTADLHFDHEKIIQYCRRPFESQRQMYKALKDNLLPLKETDELYILGDLAMTKDPEIIRGFLKGLKPAVHLILGNHDKCPVWSYLDIGISSVHTSLTVLLNPDLPAFNLFHDPAWSCCFHLQPCLCGHVHDLFTMQERTMNVGVDVWQFKPVPQTEIETRYRAVIK